ncbi:hypothetical protein GGI12_003219 [Dipsacomyces acuminosporus]|nr:hypothetical protein GGI12_003219 [Dipsacomyces acuminosporus]
MVSLSAHFKRNNSSASRTSVPPPATLSAGSKNDNAGIIIGAIQDEIQWYGAPVFDMGYWYAEGGLDLVQAKHAELHKSVEALVISCSSNETDWHWRCLALGWPRVSVIDIEYDVCNVESDPRTVQWLRMAQDKSFFPCARMYRLTTHWAGCSEVFEHQLDGSGVSNERAERLQLLDYLPPRILGSEPEVLFYRYRILFLVKVTFEMGKLAKTTHGALAMYTYLTYLLKTDIFAPKSLELSDAQPHHMQTVLSTINKNEHQLDYTSTRTVTGSTALQSSLKRLRFEMHNMAEGRHGIPFCAAHFPQLESLIVQHIPDFKGSRSSLTNLGVLFSLPWSYLVELQLPFVSNESTKTLGDKCPTLQYLTVRPEPRYERWSAYAQPFTPKYLHALACQWPNMRQLVVSYAFRQPLQEFTPLLKQPEVALPSIAASLRKRSGTPSTSLVDARFGEPEVITRLKGTGHPLENMILHRACKMEFIEKGCVQVLNLFPSLEVVTFVAVESIDFHVFAGLESFYASQNAKFAVQVDDQTRNYKTCNDFTASWEKAGDLLWSH